MVAVLALAVKILAVHGCSFSVGREDTGRPLEIRFSGIRCADASGVRILAGLRPDICSLLELRKHRSSASFRAQAVSCLLIINMSSSFPSYSSCVDIISLCLVLNMLLPHPYASSSYYCYAFFVCLVLRRLLRLMLLLLSSSYYSDYSSSSFGLYSSY